MATPVLRAPAFRTTAALCWTGWVFDFYDLILVSFLIPAIEVSLQLKPSAGVWLLGVGLGASGLGGILFGWLADLYGRKRILTVTVLLFSVGMFATGFVRTVNEFLIIRFITGLGLGGEWAVGHALIAESVPAETRGRWSAFLQSGESVGVAIAAVVGFLLAPRIGWRAVFMWSAGTALLTLFFRRFLAESPMWLKAPRKNSRTRLAELGPFLSKYWGLMLLGLVLAILKLGTYWTCYTWLPRFIRETFGLAIGKSVLWFVTGQVGQFIGMFAFGQIADRVGRRWAFTLFSTLTAMALLPLALYWTALYTTHQPLFWALMFLLGFGSGCTAGFGALLAELFPTAHRTFAMGTIYNTARGVQIFAPVLVGMAVARSGLTGGLMIPAMLAVGTACWVWTLPDRRGEELG